MTWMLMGSLLARVTVLLSLGFGAAFLLRRRSASSRHLVWAAVLVGALLLPLAALFSPQLALRVLPPESTSAQLQVGSGVRAPAAEAAVSEVPAIEAYSVKASRRSSRGGLVTLVAIGVYALGLFVVGIYFGSGIVRVWRLTKRSDRIPARAGWDSTLETLPTGGRVDLRQSAELLVPVTWGLTRARVLVPAESAGWTPDLQRQALLHELAHIDRLDWLTQQLSHAVCALLWFHPLAWMAARRLALEAEQACDDRVLLAGAAAGGYAEQLYRLARRAREAASRSIAGSDRAPLAALSFTRRPQLSTRIDSILNPQIRRSSMSRKHLVPLLLLGLLPAVVVGTLALAPVPSVEAGSEQGSVSPIIRAASSGDLAELEVLLREGADVDHVDPRRSREEEWEKSIARTPLSAAAQRGHLSVITVLLDRGAEVGLAPSGEPTALMYAAGGGHLPVVDRLISAGADVDRVIDGDGTALILAARNGQHEVVERLLGRGADPDLEVDGDGSPLVAAGRSGVLGVVQSLLDAGANPSKGVSGDGNPMIAAVDRGDLASLEALVAAGADVDATVRGDGSPLIRAAMRGDVRMVKTILDAGADVNLGVRGDGNPIIAAAKRGHLEAVQMLVDRGAEIDLVIPGDENALIGAAWNGQMETVQYLVAQGADLSRRVRADGEVRTPLSQAIRGGHEEVADWLRAAGATESVR